MSSNDKPQNLNEYREWLTNERHIEITNRTKTYYESVTSTAKEKLLKTTFWQNLCSNLQNYDESYTIETSYPLFGQPPQIDILIKPFDSVLDKSLRKNVIQNQNWPNEPPEGWILPDNWHSNLNDILRTIIVVKYLDGVKYIIDKIELLAETNNLTFDVNYEARENGYYAAHMSITVDLEVPKEDWDTKIVSFVIEIQITTQLQEAIRKLLHNYYIKTKGMEKIDNVKARWDYTNDDFSAIYLGHILHYMEGMIMEVREKQRGI